jgi:hypothetical protein
VPHRPCGDRRRVNPTNRGQALLEILSCEVLLIDAQRLRELLKGGVDENAHIVRIVVEVNDLSALCVNRDDVPRSVVTDRKV